MHNDEVKKIVKESYQKIAKDCGCSCCGGKADEERIASEIGYSKDDVANYSEANLGLGCGNPTALANIKEGDTVLDLGSGAGFDCFLAAKKVGESGRVIGVDMVPEMVEKASVNAGKYAYQNVEFRLGYIEALPLGDESIDVAISNCVINLAPDKEKVFREVFRVLKPGGKLFVSDMVLLGELNDEQRNDNALIAGCVGGAILRDEYLDLINKAGFVVKVLSEDRDISKKQYQGAPVASLKVEAVK